MTRSPASLPTRSQSLWLPAGHSGPSMLCPCHIVCFILKRELGEGWPCREGGPAAQHGGPEGGCFPPGAWFLSSKKRIFKKKMR